MPPACPRSVAVRPLDSSHSLGKRAYRADAPMRRSQKSILSAVCLVLAGLMAGCMENSIETSFSRSLLATDVTGSLAGAPRQFSLDMVESDVQPLVSEALARALDPMSNNQPVRWGEGTMSRGSLVARGRAFIFEDQICRGFHAEIERVPNQPPHQQTYQGAACRQGKGDQGLGEWRIVSGLNTEL